MAENIGYETVLLVSAPGIVREATKVMLDSLPQVNGFKLAGGALSAIDQLQASSCSLLVIDANLPIEEVESLLHWVKENSPDTRCVALARSPGELEQARAAGADYTFLRSRSAQHLAEIL